MQVLRIFLLELLAFWLQLLCIGCTKLSNATRALLRHRLHQKGIHPHWTSAVGSSSKQASTPPKAPKAIAVIVAEPQQNDNIAQQLAEVINWCSESTLQDVFVYSPSGKLADVAAPLQSALGRERFLVQAGWDKKPEQTASNCPACEKSAGPSGYGAHSEAINHNKRGLCSEAGNRSHHTHATQNGMCQAPDAHQENGHCQNGCSLAPNGGAPTLTIRHEGHCTSSTRTQPCACTSLCSDHQGVLHPIPPSECSSSLERAPVHHPSPDQPCSDPCARPTALHTALPTESAQLHQTPPPTLQQHGGTGRGWTGRSGQSAEALPMSTAGHVSAHSVSVRLLGPSDAHSPVMAVARTGGRCSSCGQMQSLKAGTYQEAGRKLYEQMAAVAGPAVRKQPEVVLVFGQSLTLAGYPPFQLPVAEIFLLGPLRQASRQGVAAALARYQRTQQRFGK